VQVDEEVVVANGIDELARRMLRAAYRRRRDMFGLPSVIAPRDDEVVRELGYERATDHEMWAAEQWLADRRYIVPAPGVGSGRAMPGGFFYTITPEGMAFMGEI
jgi:hypothetical protein